MSKNFVLIGAAGYVAPRHIKAIEAVGGNLIAAFDPHDSVGILDKYYPDCEFFTEFERLDRFCNLYQHKKVPIDYVVVCSPNYLHDSHSRWGLQLGADVICEKPLVCCERNLDELLQAESDTGHNVWPILQCRLHSSAKGVSYFGSKNVFNVNYSTPRGRWYGHTWKGVESKSGGIATNIGIHLFDLLACFFGEYQDVSLSAKTNEIVEGRITFANDNAGCFRLSIRHCETPRREFSINGTVLNLTDGFENLHTLSYTEILNGNGFSLESARGGIRIAEAIRGKQCL